MKSLDYNRWLITYLVTDSRLSFEDRERLIITATCMYLDKNKKETIKSDNFEGEIRTEGEWHNLGIFGGQRFTAKLDTNHGSSKVEFLVTEKINPNLN